MLQFINTAKNPKSDPGKRRASGTFPSAESPQEGGRPSTSFALLGYPRSRKNGGHSEAGAQPCRFIARRATNGAPALRGDAA